MAWYVAVHMSDGPPEEWGEMLDVGVGVGDDRVYPAWPDDGEFSGALLGGELERAVEETLVVLLGRARDAGAPGAVDEG